MARKKKQSSAGSQKTGRRRAASSSSAEKPDTGSTGRLDPDLVKKYYPIFDSLISFLLAPRQWWQAFRSYVQEELDYRFELLLRAFLLFVIGTILISSAMGLMVMGSYHWLVRITADEVLSAFILCGIFLLVAIVVYIIMLKIGGELFEVRKDRRGPKRTVRRPEIFDDNLEWELEQRIRQRRRKADRAAAKTNANAPDASAADTEQ